MKFVYLLEYRQLNKLRTKYELYNTDVFSSKAKIESTVKNIIEVNKGYCVSDDNIIFGNCFKNITYTCLSTDKKVMNMMLILTKKELK
jgi:hypothetical protein